MIAVAKAKLRDADLRIGDSEHLPYEDDAFELATCTFSFHHYPNPKGALALRHEQEPVPLELAPIQRFEPRGLREIGHFAHRVGE